MGVLRLWALAFGLLLCEIAGASEAYEISAVYTGELNHNTRGGLQRGGTYLDNFDLAFELDTYRAFGWSGGTFYAQLLHNNNKSYSDRFVGDDQVVSNIDSTTNVVRLYELWVEQIMGDHAFKLGVQDLNAEFDAIESAGLFLNSSHGIGPDFSQSGDNGPSIFPTPALAFRHAYTPSESLSFQWGVFDAVAGDPNDPDKNSLRISAKEGALLVSELNLHTRHTRYGLGAWYYTQDAQQNNGTSTSHNNGVYSFSDTLVGRRAHQELRAWLRLGYANGEVNKTQVYVGTGLQLKGLFAARPEDLMGLALAHASSGDNFRKNQVGPSDRAETAIEWTYRAEINHRLALQPDVQYVVNPGTDPSLKDALTVGLRFELTLL